MELQEEIEKWKKATGCNTPEQAEQMLLGINIQVAQIMESVKQLDSKADNAIKVFDSRQSVR